MVKPGWLNAGLDHLSRIENGEEHNNIDDGLPDAQFFRLEIADYYYGPIVQFLSTGIASIDMSIS